MSGGEADGARLLNLARHELLEEVLPQLSGDARYRARLIANAMKIAGLELTAGREQTEDTERLLRSFAESAIADAPDTTTDGVLAPQKAICAALRAGKLDGNAAFYDLLASLNDRRLAMLGQGQG